MARFTLLATLDITSMQNSRRKQAAFTLIELLVVISIIAILAGLIFPAFANAKKAALKTQCISNLKQIGTAITLYMGDYDDQFPHAVDASDKFRPEIWSDFPTFQAKIPNMPLMSDVLDQYLKSKEVWKCPSDNGSSVLDSHPQLDFNTSPSVLKVYQSSYFFRTEIAFKEFSSSTFKLPANTNVLFDASGHWHGDAGRVNRNEVQTDPASAYRKIIKFRYNTLFGDMHVKSLNYDKLQEAWATEL